MNKQDEIEKQFPFKENPNYLKRGNIVYSTENDRMKARREGARWMKDRIKVSKGKQYSLGVSVGIMSVLIGYLIGMLLTSCQPLPDPLKNAEFNCTVTYKGFAHEIHINCKDSLYKFRCEKYSKAYKEKDTIYDPLKK